MCNGCNHGFLCCAHDGFHCGCGLEDSEACSGEYCDACDEWYMPDYDLSHEHEDEGLYDDYYGPEGDEFIPHPEQPAQKQKGEQMPVECKRCGHGPHPGELCEETCEGENIEGYTPDGEPVHAEYDCGCRLYEPKEEAK